MITPIKIDGFEIAPNDHIAIKDKDLVYFGPYQRFGDYIKTSTPDCEKAPFGCEWVSGFENKSVAYLTERYSVIIYRPIVKKVPIKEKCPEGFKLAPMDHVLESNIDLLELPENEKHIQHCANRYNVHPPHGYEWVNIFAGNKVERIVNNGYYPRAYMPIEKLVEKEVEKPVDETFDNLPENKNLSLIFKEKCKHENYKHYEWDGLRWTVKWCRDCGSLWTKSGRKWVSPKKVKE